MSVRALCLVAAAVLVSVHAPLLWLWVGSQIEGSSSIGPAVGATFIGAVLTIIMLAVLLGKLSNVYRANRVARGLDDPGHFVLEVVLVVSASITLVVFVVWFFFFAGAEPLPVGIKF